MNRPSERHISKFAGRLHRLLPAWVATAAVAALILWLTLSPAPVGKVDVPMFPGEDKVVHAVMFCVLTLAICYDAVKFRSTHKPATDPLPWIAGALSILMGTGIEFAQRAMELGRSFETGDIIADACGALAGAVAAACLLSRKRQSSSR